MRSELGPAAHVDEYALLCYIAGELHDLDARRVEIHVRTCATCAETLAGMRWLDAALTEHREVAFERNAFADALPADDALHERPLPADRTSRPVAFGGPAFLDLVLSAGREARAASPGLLDVPPDALASRLQSLKLETLQDRYVLGYALDDALHRMIDRPAAFRRFAEKALRRLAVEPARPLSSTPPDALTPADVAYPLDELTGRAHLVAGSACLWSNELEEGGRHLLAAWRSFEAGCATALSFAFAERYASQRRSFADRPHEARSLAVRARRTFEDYGDEANRARADYAAGLALSTEGREEDALVSFRAARDTFLECGLFGAYVSALNSIGLCLLEVGKVAAATHEYALALRITQRHGQLSYRPYLRMNLSRTLFAHGRYAEAVRGLEAAARLFGAAGAHADEAIAVLYLAECLARSGRLDAARHTVSLMEEKLTTSGSESARQLVRFREELASGDPDFQALAALRTQTERSLRAV